MAAKSAWLLPLAVAMMVFWVWAVLQMSGGHAPMLSSLEHPVITEHHVLESRRNLALLEQQQQPQLSSGDVVQKLDNAEKEARRELVRNLVSPALRGGPEPPPPPPPPPLPPKQAARLAFSRSPPPPPPPPLRPQVPPSPPPPRPAAPAGPAVAVPSTVTPGLRAPATLGMPENPTIFMSIAAYREQRGARTIASAFANAVRPERLFVGLYQQRDPEKDPDGLNFTHPTDFCGSPAARSKNAALCEYGPTHVNKVEVHWTKSEGPCVARARAEQMYMGQDFVFQIDAHSTFVPKWDEMMLRMWQQTNNEFAVLSGYPRSEGQMGQSHFRNLPMICTARMLDWSVRDMLKNTAGDAPMRPHPVRTPYFGAGLVFSKAHRLAAVPYDPYLHYLFDGEEFDMAMRLFTSGYDVYAPNETPLFHFYSSPADNKRMGIAKFWDYHWGQRFPIMFQSTRRIRHKVGIPAVLKQDPQINNTKNTDILTELDKYRGGTRRTVPAFLEYAGVDLIGKKVHGACRNVRAGLKHAPWVTDTGLDHGIDGKPVL